MFFNRSLFILHEYLPGFFLPKKLQTEYRMTLNRKGIGYDILSIDFILAFNIFYFDNLITNYPEPRIQNPEPQKTNNNNQQS